MKRFTELEEMEILELYRNRESIAFLIKKFGTHHEKIRNILSKNGEKIRKRKTTLDESYFETIDTPEKAYWLGFIAADGCVAKNGYKLTFAVADSDILPKIQRALKASSPVSFSKRKGNEKYYNSYSLQLCSKQLCKGLVKNGVDENKSKNFKFPILEEKLYSHFVRGLYDGDGSISLNKLNALEEKFSSIKVNIISTVEGVLFLNNYVKNQLNLKSTKPFHKEKISYFIICRDSLKFLEWMYIDSTEETRLNRKYEKFILAKKLYEKKWPEIIIYNEKNEVFARTKKLKPVCVELCLPYHQMLKSLNNNKPILKGDLKGWKVVKAKISL